MLTVLIVDDETIFRKGLRHMIAGMGEEWAVIDEAKDGMDALEKADLHHPDVIITDIRMPRMDGIQLQYIVKERFPGTQCLVMSGFDDFDYVRNSFRLGAKDYLLKPVSKGDLSAALNKVKAECQERKERANRYSREDLRIRRELRQHMLNSLMTGNLSQDEYELLEKVGLSFPHSVYCCLIADMDRESVEDGRYYQSDPALFSIFIAQFIQEIISEYAHGYAFVMPDSNAAAVINYEHREGVLAKVFELAELIRKEIKAVSDLTVTIGVGDPVFDIEMISKSFKEAEMSLLYRLITGGNRLIAYGSKSVQSFRPGNGSGTWANLEQAVQEGRIDLAEHLVERIVSDLIHHSADPNWIQEQVCKLVLHYYELAMEMSITDIWLPGGNIKIVLGDIFRISERGALIARCRDLIGGLCRAIVESMRHTSTDAIETIIRHVREHYGEPITLGMMAEKVHLNPSYLSSLFKGKIGKNFVDFVTEVRIEEAKSRLLGTADKIAVIAEAIGFLNLRHFNRVFKAETGMTPKQYREHVPSP